MLVGDGESPPHRNCRFWRSAAVHCAIPSSRLTNPQRTAKNNNVPKHTARSYPGGDSVQYGNVAYLAAGHARTHIPEAPFRSLTLVHCSPIDQPHNTIDFLPDTGDRSISLELVLDGGGVDIVGSVNALGDSGVLVGVVGNDVGLGVLDVLAVDLEGQGGSRGGDLFSGEWRHGSSSWGLVWLRGWGYWVLVSGLGRSSGA